MSFFHEFREFAVKGNAVDMAVGIILGAAFNKVVQSIVNDLIMPPLGLLLGRVDFKDLSIVLQEATPAVTDASGATIAPAVPEVAIRYGLFIGTVVEFLIVALSIFVVVRIMNRIIRQRSTQPPAA